MNAEWNAFMLGYSAKYPQLEAALRFFTETLLRSPCDLCRQLHAALDSLYLQVCDIVSEAPDASIPERIVTYLEQLAAFFFDSTTPTPVNNTFITTYGPSFFRDFVSFIPSSDLYVSRLGTGHCSSGVEKSESFPQSLKQLGDLLLRWCLYLEEILRNPSFFCLPDSNMMQFWRLIPFLHVPAQWQNGYPQNTCLQIQAVALHQMIPELYAKDHSSRLFQLVDEYGKSHFFSLQLRHPIDVLFTLSTAVSQLFLQTVLLSREGVSSPVSLPRCIPVMTPIHPCALLVETTLTITSMRGVIESTFKNQQVPFTQELWNTTTIMQHDDIIRTMRQNVPKDYLKQFVLVLFFVLMCRWNHTTSISDYEAWRESFSRHVASFAFFQLLLKLGMDR